MNSTYSDELKKEKLQRKDDNDYTEDDNQEFDDDTKDNKKNKRKKEGIIYDFESNREYYDERNENEIIGIIDKNYNRHSSNNDDIFKIRGKRSKILVKKRGTGIPTLKGAVCSTSKDKDYLIKLLKQTPNVTKEEINHIIKETRTNICDLLKIKLLYLEKFSTKKEKNKLTYIIIPYNHPIYQFPYNLEDRIDHTIENIEKIIDQKIKPNIKKEKNGIFMDKRNKDYPKYIIEFKNTKSIAQYKKKLEKINGKINTSGIWNFIIE